MADIQIFFLLNNKRLKKKFCSYQQINSIEIVKLMTIEVLWNS